MANISHFTQTVNGVSTTYDIHDANAIPRSGGAVMISINGAPVHLGTTSYDNEFLITPGISWSNSPFITMYGSNHPTTQYRGAIRIVPRISVSGGTKDMRLEPSGTWTWNGTACQITSDARLKQQIAGIDDKLLDAWEDVNLVQFKYNDAVEQKGKDKARLHTGYVVQQIDNACKSHGVDVSEYGLYCHEEYPQETEEVEVEQADGTKTKERKVIREASEHYSLRYTEVYAVECMYLRRCIARLTARIEELEKGNNTK